MWPCLSDEVSMIFGELLDPHFIYSYLTSQRTFTMQCILVSFLVSRFTAIPAASMKTGFEVVS